jgi:hypothetical protein
MGKKEKSKAIPFILPVRRSANDYFIVCEMNRAWVLNPT